MQNLFKLVIEEMHACAYISQSNSLTITNKKRIYIGAGVRPIPSFAFYIRFCRLLMKCTENELFLRYRYMLYKKGRALEHAVHLELYWRRRKTKLHCHLIRDAVNFRRRPFTYLKRCITRLLALRNTVSFQHVLTVEPQHWRRIFLSKRKIKELEYVFRHWSLAG